MGGRDAFDCAAWCSAELGPPHGPIWPEKKGWLSGSVHKIASRFVFIRLYVCIIGLKGWFGGSKSGGGAAAGSEAADIVAAAQADAEGGEFDPDADDSDEES
jgi:hypothetical protein